MSLTVGSRLGHYDVIALIGGGGMGQGSTTYFSSVRLADDRARLLHEMCENSGDRDHGVLTWTGS